ncbi:hypothetical protein A3A69_00640 [candidate division WWE3 bacterium RIFCSPLOWO2_01_FULL_37_15]|uniref:DUF4145 domain-containing protein n=1 Tax=candidate division WWE3 bacterium RIFCSPLOWO2_01_FULL_37_15 TaxID=1802622 RepID=A0A1F4UUG3_UNCKA|nr:MAG: hypothetical protein A3A69_00640 [candidate division WWE3 bacterium RIFCSPLOWO2_01_FULL_37_15]
MLNLIKKLLGFAKGYRRYSVSQPTEDRIKTDWIKIDELLRLRSPSQLRQALISADRSLDQAMKDIFDGETMGERLKNAKDRFEKNMYNKIWEAHKIRNNLVHEAAYEPPYYVVTEAVETFRMALRLLNIKV